MRTLPSFVAFSLLGAATAQTPQSFTYPQLLDRMVDVDWLWQPPAAGERCVQFSSYDRRSDKGPADFDAWYANDDRGQYLRVEERDGRKEHVMVDVEGPGVLSRIWSANPSGELFFDIDGERVWTVDFKALTCGEVAPVGEPLAGLRARGANCYLPIPFAKSLQVSASKGDFYYQCNVTTFPKGTTVPSFTPALLQEHEARIRGLDRAVMEPAKMVTPSGLEGPAPCWRVDVPAGSIVRQVDVRLARFGRAEDVPEQLRKVLLVVRCNDEETVRVPVGDFFCAAGWKGWRGARLGLEVAAYCAFPMPMPTGGSIELVPDDGEPVASRVLQLSLAVRHEPLPETAANPLLFRASYHQEKGFASRPFHDFAILDAKGGPGRFVGCSLLVKNPTRAWWGEGDEKFFVDGEDFPSTFGTGTEDYFGYAWCCPEPFQSAFHAQTQCDGPGNYGFTALHRTQLLDSVPFQRSFRFDMEVWHWVEGLKMDYASVAYWYGAAGALSGLPPVPPAAERTLDRLPAPPVFVAEGCIEGERLRVVEATGGTNEVQDLAFRENTFSRDAHRWWRDAAVGDALVLAVPVAETARYRVTGAFCMANDYGIVKLSLAGQPLGEPFDGYAQRVESSGPRELGTVDLEQGEALLRVEIVGRNEKAVPKHMFGLDYLRLEKVR